MKVIIALFIGIVIGVIIAVIGNISKTFMRYARVRFGRGQTIRISQCLFDGLRNHPNRYDPTHRDFNRYDGGTYINMLILGNVYHLIPDAYTDLKSAVKFSKLGQTAKVLEKINEIVVLEERKEKG